MNKIIDAMIDFETLGTSSNAVVVQIGAVKFERETGLILHAYKENISIQSCLNIGMEVDESTLDWWLMQSEDARKSISHKNKTDCLEAFSILNTFLIGADLIWCHNSFDFPILNHYLKVLEIKPSYSFRKSMDIRTLMSLLEMKNIEPIKIPRQGTHHDALDDCSHQVEYVVKNLKLGGFI